MGLSFWVKLFSLVNWILIVFLFESSDLKLLNYIVNILYIFYIGFLHLSITLPFCSWLVIATKNENVDPCYHFDLT